MTSYKPEVRCYGEKDFAGNALRFATKAEAELYVHDLMMRWTRVDDTRVVESDDPVNYMIMDGKCIAIADFSNPALEQAKQ